MITVRHFVYNKPHVHEDVHEADGDEWLLAHWFCIEMLDQLKKTKKKRVSNLVTAKKQKRRQR